MEGFVLKDNDSKSAATESPQESVIEKMDYSCQVDHDSTAVYVQGWRRKRSKKPPILFIHDLGESTKLYEPLAHHLNSHGFNVYGYDQRGHGRSGKHSRQTPSFGQLVIDLLQVAAWVRHEERGRVPLLVSQGMGALVGVAFARRYPQFLKGIAMAAPMFSLVERIPPWRRFLLQTMDDLFPRFSVPKRLSPMFTSPRQKIGGDRPIKFQTQINAHFTNDLLKAVGQSRKHLNRMRSPALILCPKKDPICRYQFLKRLTQKHPCVEDISLHYFDNDRHHLLVGDEGETQEVFRRVTEWANTFDLSHNKPPTIPPTKD